jgi:hypothetical protein
LFEKYEKRKSERNIWSKNEIKCQKFGNTCSGLDGEPSYLQKAVRGCFMFFVSKYKPLTYGG